MKAKKLLQGEQVLIETKSHGSSLAKAFIRFLLRLCLSLLVYGLIVRNHKYVFRQENSADPNAWLSFQRWVDTYFDALGMIMLIVIITVAVVFAYRIIEWNTTWYIVTNRRVLTRRGIFGRLHHLLTMNITEITDSNIVLKKSFMQRLVRSGDIMMRTPDSYDPLTQHRKRSAQVLLKNMPEAKALLTMLRHECCQFPVC